MHVQCHLAIGDFTLQARLGIRDEGEFVLRLSGCGLQLLTRI